MRVDVHGVAWRGSPASGTGRHWAKAGGVGSGLGAELREIEIGTGTVTLGHGLPELTLGPESVEDDAVDGDAENFDNHLDDAADKSPVLKTADKTVGNVILKEMPSLVIDTGPTPHVLVVVLRFALVEHSGTDGPHDDAEDEESNGKDGVVSSDFLCFPVTSFPVGDDDNNGHDQGKGGNREKQDLGPDSGVLRPWWETVSWREGFCGVEDCEGCCDHGQNDETAGEVDAAKEYLG